MRCFTLIMLVRLQLWDGLIVVDSLQHAPTFVPSFFSS